MIVKQIDNFLELLSLFAREQTPRTLTQVSADLELAKSSTFNMLRTLVARGVIYEVAPRAGYYPTRFLLELTRTITEGDPISRQVHLALESLAQQTGETVLLAARDGDEVVYVDAVESAALVRYAAKPGDRRPVYATSGGKAILSTYPERRRKRELAAIRYTRHRQGTFGDADSLAQELEESVSRGWFRNLSEYTPDVTGIALPLVIRDRRYGLSVAGPNFRMEGRHAEIAAAISDTIEGLESNPDLSGEAPVGS